MIALLHFAVDPHFLDVPLNQRFADGTDAVIQCPAVFGTDPQTEMQWFIVGDQIITNSSRFTAEFGRLTIHNIRRSDGDVQYRCIIQKPGEPNIGRTIKVEVLPRHKYVPRINDTDRTIEVDLGQPLNLSCSLEEPRDDVVYSWTINTELEHDILTSSSYVHREPFTFVGGIYTCKAENEFGYDIVDFSVKVLSKWSTESLEICSDFERIQPIKISKPQQ